MQITITGHSVFLQVYLVVSNCFLRRSSLNKENKYLENVTAVFVSIQSFSVNVTCNILHNM